MIQRARTMRCSIFIIIASVLYATAEIQSPPEITKQPPTDELLFQVANSNVDKNDKPFMIECDATGEPAPKFNWIKNGKPYDWSAYDDRITQQPGRGSLVISKPANEDSGQYQCIASNEFGTAISNSVFVRKTELNSFKDETPKTIEAEEGVPYKLSCEPPDGWPKPRVIWMQVRDDDGVGSLNNSRMTVDPEGNLWFSNLTKADTSNGFSYACAAFSVYRNEYKIGNKFKIVVKSSGSSSSQNKREPALQYATRRNEVAYRGRERKLYCIYSGTPLPQIVWFRNGSALNSSNKVTHGDYGKSLIIKRVNYEDRGTYTCVASNGVGREQSHTIDLAVRAVPFFTISPEKVNAAEDETAEFHCEAEGEPKPEIKWIHNGKPIELAPPNPRRELSKNSIIIRKLQKSDTGNYGCNATNSEGYVYKDVYLNVLAIKAEITEKPTQTDTVDGKNVTMTCRVFGAPKPMVKWIRNGQELTGGHFRTLPTNDLEISNVGFTDSGRYQCHAENKLGYDDAEADLIVKEHTRITTFPEDYEVAAGARATFRCNAVTDSRLTLTIDWLRNGQPIDSDQDPRFVVASDYSLSVTKSTELDSGTYTCKASTELDEAKAEATLIVQDVPNAPRLLSTECGARIAALSWLPRGDNRAPILHFQVEYNTSFTPDSWEIFDHEVPATDSKSDIPMSPWANYTFRVRAKNKIGISLPSAHGKVCTTLPAAPDKNPSNVMGNGTQPHNLVITWTVMPQIEHNAPKFMYRVSYRKDIEGISWTHKDITDWRVNRLEINNQPTYQRYQIQVRAINEESASLVEPKIVYGYSAEDVPQQAPEDFVTIGSPTSTSATFSWTPVPPESAQGELRGYKIQTWSDRDGEAGMREIDVPGGKTSQATINKLTPFSKNYVRILAYNGRYYGGPSNTLVVDTPEGVPGTVLSFEAYPIGSSALHLQWTKPDEENGNLTGYRIYYQEVNGTALGPLLERPRQVTDPKATAAKLARLAPDTKYRVHIRATTKAGEGGDFYVEESTRHSRKPDVPMFKWETIPKENGYANVKVIWLPDHNGYPGSHFFARYKLKGETQFSETDHEFHSNEIEIRGLQMSETYIISIVAVDGDYVTESERQSVETSSEGPIIQPKENVATAGWFIGMMLAIAFLLMVLVIVCIIKRNRGGKYAVHERELAAGRGDYPEEGGFHEYSQPLDTKSTGGRASLASSSHQDGKHPESDTDSMAEYGEGDTEGMNEDGSFIGQYGRQRKSEPNSQAFATLV